MSLSSTPIGQVTELQSKAKMLQTKVANSAEAKSVQPKVAPAAETRKESGVAAANDASRSSRNDERDSEERQQLVEREVSLMNEGLKRADDHLKFSVHKETGRVIVRLMDDESGEVLREIPSEKFLNMVVHLQESLSGAQVDVTL